MKYQLEGFIKDRVQSGVPHRLISKDRIISMFKESKQQNDRRYIGRRPDMLRGIKTQHKGSEITVQFEFTNGWYQSHVFNRFDDRKAIAGKLLALSKQILHNENLDAEGLPDAEIEITLPEEY